MSDGRLQSSRDDRHRGHGGDRRDHRRSRSPHDRRQNRRGGPDVDSYSSTRGYRDREREERYQGGGGRRDDRDWGRDRGSQRRDARRDDDGDRRRGGDRRGGHDRGDDLFADRRGGGRRDDRGPRDGGPGGDRGRDRDDMRQLERQAARKSASPERKPKEPTPDLTDIVPILEKKRRLTQWDIKPPGYENVTAEQAKLSGMFPLPGAPRQPAMDASRLRDMMAQPGAQANNTALKPSSARQSKRLMIYNIPESATDDNLVDFFNLQLNGLNVTKSADPCISAQSNKANGYALLEFKTPEDATNAMAFDGISMDSDVQMGNGSANGTSKGLEIKRPKDYIVPTVMDETESTAGIFSSVVPDTQNKISMTNIPIYLGEDQITELLTSFGELRNFVVMKDKTTGESRGIAFCEYKDPSVTKIAVEALNGMELGEAAMKVRLASVGVQQVSGEMTVNAMGMMAATPQNADSELGRVLCLMNMITPEELMDPEEADGKFAWKPRLSQRIILIMHCRNSGRCQGRVLEVRPIDRSEDASSHWWLSSEPRYWQDLSQVRISEECREGIGCIGWQEVCGSDCGCHLLWRGVL